MISDAFVFATCDKCGYETTIPLTALAMRNSYDTRNVRSELEHDGWRVDEDLDHCICDTCVEEESADDE